MYSIDCVVPYENLIDVVKQAYDEHPRKNEIQFKLHPLAIYAIEGYKLYGDVAIARGLSASYIKKSYKWMPVVEIPMSGYDIWNAFNEALTYKPRHVALIALENTIYGTEQYGARMFPSYSTYSISSFENIETAIATALKDGVDLIIGGNAVYGQSISIGVNTVLVRSGKESVRLALDESLRMLDSQQEQKMRAERLQALVDNVSEGIVSVDKHRNINICNIDAAKMIHCLNDDNIIGKNINDVFPQLNKPDIAILKRPILGDTLVYDNKSIAVNRVPILVDNEFSGGVYTFQEVSQIQKIENNIRKRACEKGLVARWSFNDIVSESDSMRNVKELARKYSQVDANILLLGETGTGKEMFAQSIHRASNRALGPFVAVNCAALPESLLESELFGYVGGAFTGANKDGKVGLFELAHKGTIFLDEISEMSLSLQGRLLRVLEERSIRRIGHDTVIPIDIRIIAATNRNIQDSVRNNSFRKDLYYRLNVLRLDIPPLRERGADILVLAKHYLELYDKQNHSRSHVFGPDCIPVLLGHQFQGNVRELKSLCEWLSVVDPEPMINASMLLDYFKPEERQMVQETVQSDMEGEKEKLKYALSLFKKKKDIADYLQIDRSTLYRKLAKYNLL